MPPKKKVSKMNPRQLQAYYNSPAFREDCAEAARMEREAREAEVAAAKAAIVRLWSEDSTSSPTEPSPYDPPRLEAYLYHCGVSGSDYLGPKLIYRTSKDKEPFIPPAGPDAPRRLMSFRGPPRNHKLRQDDIWHAVVGEVTKALGKHGIGWTTLKPVRFAWDAESEEESTKDENGYYISGPDGPLHLSPVTIWVGVKPDSTTSEEAHHASVDLLALLQHDLTDVEVAFCECLVERLW